MTPSAGVSPAYGPAFPVLPCPHPGTGGICPFTALGRASSPSIRQRFTRAVEAGDAWGAELGDKGAAAGRWRDGVPGGAGCGWGGIIDAWPGRGRAGRRLSGEQGGG